MDFVKVVSVVIPISSWRKRFRIAAWMWLYGRYARRAGKIDPTCKFFGRAKLNGGTVVKAGTCIGGLEVSGSGAVYIGRYCHLAPDILIMTQNHDYDTGETIPYGKHNVCKEVRIDDFVWIGRRVIILPGAYIGEGAIIQAGAVVHGKIPPMAIAGGNPACVFKCRDKCHFDKLKAQGAVH